MKNIRFSVVAAGLCAVASNYASGAPIAPQFEVDRPGAARPAGWILDRALAARNGLTGHLEETDQHFRIAWTTNAVRRGKDLQWFDLKKGSWSAEGGAYWFDGLVRLAWQLDDPMLKDLAKRRLEPVLQNTNTNAIGLIWWLNRNKPDELKEATSFGRWHLEWVLGTAVRSLAAYYEVTGDERAKHALENAYSCLEVAKRCGRKGSASFVSGAFEAWCHTRSPEVAACLDCSCDQLKESQFASLPWDRLHETLNLKRAHERRFHLESRHGVYCAEQLLSVLALYRWRGDENVKKAIYAWCDFLEKYCGQPYGLFMADEEWGWAGAYRGTETCIAAAEMYAFIRMEAVFADGRRGDDVERAYFNSGAAAVSRDFKRHLYCQMPNRTGVGREISQCSSLTYDPKHVKFCEKHWPLCCTASASRIIPDYVQGMWMKTADGGIAATLYGPSTYATKIASGEIAVEEKTNYPFEENITVTFKRAPAKPFPFKLRIPGWCKAPAVDVNGKRIALSVTNGFTTVTRAWNAGDTVMLHFPMHASVRHWRDMNEFGKKRMSVSYGPLLFAYPFAERDENTPAVTPREPTLAENLDAAKIAVVRNPMPKVWDWPFAAPIRLRLSDAVGNPLELIPYGCARLRVSAFPVAGTPQR